MKFYDCASSFAVHISAIFKKRDGGTYGRTYGWTYGRTFRQTDLRMDRQTDLWTDGLTYGRTTGRTDERTDPLIQGCPRQLYYSVKLLLPNEKKK